MTTPNLPQSTDDILDHTRGNIGNIFVCTAHEQRYPLCVHAIAALEAEVLNLVDDAMRDSASGSLYCDDAALRTSIRRYFGAAVTHPTPNETEGTEE